LNTVNSGIIINTHRTKKGEKNNKLIRTKVLSVSSPIGKAALTVNFGEKRSYGYFWPCPICKAIWFVNVVEENEKEVILRNPLLPLYAKSTIQ